MTVFEKGLITMLGFGLISAVLAVPLALRKVPRNIVYGFRTRSTMSSDSVWYEANAHFGRGLVIASLITIFTALLLYVIPGIPPEFFLTISVVVLVAPSLIAAVATARFIRTLKSTDKQEQ